jgi:hypothetical protein
VKRYFEDLYCYVKRSVEWSMKRSGRYTFMCSVLKMFWYVKKFVEDVLVYIEDILLCEEIC